MEIDCPVTAHVECHSCFGSRYIQQLRTKEWYRVSTIHSVGGRWVTVYRQDGWKYTGPPVGYVGIGDGVHRGYPAFGTTSWAVQAHSAGEALSLLEQAGIIKEDN